MDEAESDRVGRDLALAWRGVAWRGVAWRGVARHEAIAVLAAPLHLIALLDK